MGRLLEAATERILTIDIERIPGRFELDWRGLHVTGDFWDLKDGKYRISRYINPDEVVEWPATICAAWRWNGRGKYGFSSVWSSENLVADLWELLDQADIIVGHNVDQFDLKKIRASMLLQGLPPPRPYKTVDTLKVLRSRFGLESNTLRSACERLGVKTKVDTYNVTMARDAVAGKVSAQRRIERYNKGDIAATDALKERLLPWISNHPHVNTKTFDACNRCGSTDLEPLPTPYRAVLLEYPQLRCINCGGIVRSGSHSRRFGTTRGV